MIPLYWVLVKEYHLGYHNWDLWSIICFPYYGRPAYSYTNDLDSERGNFKLFGLIYQLYLRKFELFGARLLKKRA